MKKKSILLCLSLVVMIVSFATSASNQKVKPAYDLTKDRSTIIVISDSLLFEPPVESTDVGSDFYRIFVERGRINRKKANVKNISEFTTCSKFLFIVDDNGNIIDGQPLENNKSGKDLGVFNEFLNAKLFLAPAKLNGTPCYCYAIASYYTYADGSTMELEYRPLANVTSIKK